MEDVAKGLPPTSSEWKEKAWRSCSSRMKRETMAYTLRQACSRASCGPAAAMLRNERKGTVPSLR